MQTTWQDLKQRASDKQLNLQFVEYESKYTVSLFESTQILFTFIDITDPRNADQIDFEDNFKSIINKNLLVRTTLFSENDQSAIGNVEDSLKTHVTNNVDTTSITNLYNIINSSNWMKLAIYDEIETEVDDTTFTLNYKQDNHLIGRAIINYQDSKNWKIVLERYLLLESGEQLLLESEEFALLN
jgi:hypothetical protein